jgi:hypothetical protein
MMPVFISHSFKDEAIYTTLCMALDAAGIVRWNPESMSAGDSLSEQLRDAINACEVCVSIATRRSIESPWCLAELGAFWGSGKRVILFLVDPDLTETMLPPQFKGNLRAHTAQDLIGSVLDALSTHTPKGRIPLEFFESSAVFGPDSQWRALLELSQRKVCIMGVSLIAWVRMQDFASLVQRKADQDGIEFNFMTLHPENPSIDELDRTKRTAESASLVRRQIQLTSASFIQLASTCPKVHYRHTRTRTPNFNLTLTDQTAVLVQYLHSLNWGSGPVLQCPPNSAFYSILEREFLDLWQQAEDPSVPDESQDLTRQ